MNDYRIENRYGYSKTGDYLEKVIDHTLKKLGIENATFSIQLIDDEEMRVFNKKYRGIDQATDVLSFALEDDFPVHTPIRFLGDVFISIPKMQKQAKEYGHSEERELSFLVVHGLLHLLGYDHTKGEEEERIQFGLQEEILKELGMER